MNSTTPGQARFSQVPSVSLERSKFNRSCSLKTAFDSGWLIPIFTEECLPGDTMSLRMNTFARLATPIVPILDNMHLDSFFFFVPNRLLWNKWERFNGAQPDPDDSTDFTIPQIGGGAGGHTAESMSDYFGLPVGIPNIASSCLYHRAYNLIWNEWFRDENLQDSATFGKGDGPDFNSYYPLRRRGKRHDYFTSCLPWPQKGPSVTIPIGDTAPVTMDTQSIGATSDLSPITLVTAADGIFNVATLSGVKTLEKSGANATASQNTQFSNSGLETLLGGATGEADLSLATAQTINSLRQAFQIQRLYERDARGGTRYTEIIRAHFGVTSPDQRLQRPEYLGGGTQTINITPVPQTSSSDVTTPQGNLAGYGVSSGSGHTFNKSFTEHGIIIGLVSVRADLTYQQGLSRAMSRMTRWDYYWPALSHLGEQAVLNQEIYAQDPAGPDNLLVFGYQERFAEYRYKPSQITGKMRSTDPTSLDFWHLAQEFTSLPVLDDTFIQDTPPIPRIVVVDTEPEFLFDAFFEFVCARPMPTYSTPGMIDHF